MRSLSAACHQDTNYAATSTKLNLKVYPFPHVVPCQRLCSRLKTMVQYYMQHMPCRECPHGLQGICPELKSTAAGCSNT
jgi:hypothetical protein